MEMNMNGMSEQVKKCQCGLHHYDINIEKMVIHNDAFQDAVSFIQQKTTGHVMIVADCTTNEIAGENLRDILERNGIEVDVCLVQPDDQGDVVADAESIVQVMLAVSKRTDILLAVGAGTIHDITRIVSYKMNKEFISIPTAPSVDGFNSMGAPIIVRGVKKTYQTQAPIALFANLTILKQAPKKMIAAGFGDMLGKSTSLADWKFSHLIGDEIFCPLAYEMTKSALEDCVTNVSSIANGEEEGIQTLTEALIKSGLAMLLIGHSHPASGAEHHLSHYWEMDFIRRNKQQVMHGAKVSISCSIIADLYKEEVRKLVSNVSVLNEHSDEEHVQKVLNHREEVMEIINEIPKSSSIKEMISTLGGEVEPIELGIETELLKKSLKEAHLLRDRYTFLKFFNTMMTRINNKVI
ncbi:sn-glycerol-1-phosphate dehydrogenase [Evansella halocellulosilytica]|uniref:sn-glycerol-1-phosphate dehydrogenase n=1 Tax=Evansella halocellulosilytica TaxID=2011013 RepID=UPI00211BF4A8|nr:sn-glycerol-1-phosphate dehydrogenase [Evansella halocellulosilytica]